MGSTLYLNDCLCQDVVAGAGGAGGIASIIAGICPPAAPVAGILGGVLMISAAWMGWADSHCGGRGANLNFSWLHPSAAWISPVC